MIRDRQTETERDRERDGERVRERVGETDRQTDRQTDRGRETERYRCDMGGTLLLNKTTDDRRKTATCPPYLARLRPDRICDLVSDSRG